jgi:glutaredoxin-dependent peroxiredoxin
MAIAVGSKAPDFTLKTKTADGLKDVSLSDHAGVDNVVLLFFPAAFTGVCTQEMCDVAGGVHPLPGAVVYGISHDSPFAQEAWAKASNISVVLLSDYSNTVAEAYDVVLPDLVGLGPAAKRAAFVVGKDGVVKYSEATATPLDLPNFAAIADILSQL